MKTRNTWCALRSPQEEKTKHELNLKSLEHRSFASRDKKSPGGRILLGKLATNSAAAPVMHTLQVPTACCCHSPGHEKTVPRRRSRVQHLFLYQAWMKLHLVDHGPQLMYMM